MVFNVNGELHVFGLEKSPIFTNSDMNFNHDFNNLGFCDAVLLCSSSNDK